MTIWVNQHRKGKTNLDFNEASDDGIAVASAGPYVCKSLVPHSSHVTMPAPHHSIFYMPDALPDAQPTVSVHWWQQFKLEKNKILVHNNNNNNCFTALCSGLPGWAGTEETLSHPSSWSSSNLYLLLPSTTIYSILLVMVALCNRETIYIFIL